MEQNDKLCKIAEIFANKKPSEILDEEVSRAYDELMVLCDELEFAQDMSLDSFAPQVLGHLPKSTLFIIRFHFIYRSLLGVCYQLSPALFFNFRNAKFIEVLTILSVLLFFPKLGTKAKVRKRFHGSRPSVVIHSEVCRKLLIFSSERYFLPPMVVAVILPVLIYFVMVPFVTPKRSAASARL